METTYVNLTGGVCRVRQRLKQETIDMLYGSCYPIITHNAPSAGLVSAFLPRWWYVQS